MPMPPVLFLVFNRPDTTMRVFAAIRRARPTRLYVAGDGPRADRPGESQRCAEARCIATAVDWSCEVKTLFRDQNLGCRRAVFEAISWFFQNEPEGIILEDDLLPDATFFDYCAELLERYRDDPKVMAICGGGYSDAECFQQSSYTFARAFDPWGWASWHRAWLKHDGAFDGLDQFKRRLRRVGPRGFDCHEYWLKHFRETAEGTVDTWDYPWMFTIFRTGGLVAYPATNLISNIGFRDDATHTLPRANGQRSKLAEMPTFPLSFPISHPRHVRNNPSFEMDLYARRFERTRSSRMDALIRTARVQISRRVPEPVKARLRAWKARRLVGMSN